MNEIVYKEWSDCFIKKNIHMSPHQFLKYDSEDDVRDEIYDIFYNNIEYGDIQVENTFDQELIIPDEFWEEWRRLKELSKKL